MKNGLDHVTHAYAFWGKHARLYDAQDLATFMGRAKKIRGRAVESLGLKNGDRVLEVACGSGRNFGYLEDVVGASGSILGVDYSHEMLKAARQLCERRGWKNVTLKQGDAATMEIADKDFDGVISVLGISAVPDWERALERCYDVLRVGGRMVVCDARPFDGVWRFLNPLVRIVYGTFAAWDPSKDILGKMRAMIGSVHVERFNLGTFYIAAGEKTKK